MLSAYRQKDYFRYDIVVTGEEIKKLSGKNLKRLRIAHGIESQESLARMIETPTGHYNLMENGKRGIGPELMERLCKALNVRPADFYYESDKAIPKTTDKILTEIISIYRDLDSTQRDMLLLLARERRLLTIRTSDKGKYKKEGNNAG